MGAWRGTGGKPAGRRGLAVALPLSTIRLGIGTSPYVALWAPGPTPDRPGPTRVVRAR